MLRYDGYHDETFPVKKIIHWFRSSESHMSLDYNIYLEIFNVVK